MSYSRIATGEVVDAGHIVAGITRCAFPTPNVAIRTDDPDELSRICAFADHQAAAARTIAAQVLRVLAAAPTPDTVAAAVTTALSTAEAWRYELAESTGEQRRGQGLSLSPERFRAPITDETPNLDRLGYVGRARVGSVWDPATRTYIGGAPTPAYETLRAHGQAAIERMAREIGPRHDALQNLVHLADGSIVLGNRLLRGVAARDAAAELAARIAARGADATRIETGGHAVYTATATSHARARLRQAAITALVTALIAGDRGHTMAALRQWAHAAYYLYQSPQTKKGSDAVTRVVLVALGTIALRRIPRIPHDVDLRAYVLGQDVFVEQLLAHQNAAAPAILSSVTPVATDDGTEGQGLLRVLIGSAAAGKSTWCRQNAGRIGTVLSLDEARARLGRHAHDQEAAPAAVADVRQAMDEVLRAGGEVTLDTTATVAAHRATWLEVAQRHQARVIAVVFEVPLDVAQDRNAARARPVPAEVLACMWHEAHALTAGQLRSEGFAAVYRPDQPGPSA